MKFPICRVVKKKHVCVAEALSDFVSMLLLGGFNFRYWVFAGKFLFLLILLFIFFSHPF